MFVEVMNEYVLDLVGLEIEWIGFESTGLERIELELIGLEFIGWELTDWMGHEWIQPNSFGIDRTGMGWVRFDSIRLPMSICRIPNHLIRFVPPQQLR